MPEEPVINKTTGHIYEKRLIEKTIQVCMRPSCSALLKEHVPLKSTCLLQETGQDPLSNQPLSLDDLLDVKSNKVCSLLRRR